ncbi:Protein CBG20443 [Caenorhabditis briggsae]|uniref:Protein CBG20443 n=1 Tax=Caenorhabditis briggsae TaxID=6238 RepID=A8XXU0_CAEBR|nr:Protein CBG20443 [Caenorhabditis briggsae]CAP37459.2 Protein CBG20443 [Caenorhabditis briggsae]
MAEDIGIEPCFDMEDVKPRKEALKKMKKPERSAPVKSDTENPENSEKQEEKPAGEMSKTQKRKLKKAAAIERKEKGEAIIKKDVEDGKITVDEAHTLYRVYNRNLRIKRLRDKLNKTLGEGAPLEAVKQKINDWRAAGKVTATDAMVLVKRWKTRETRRIGRQDQKITGAACFHCREPGHRLVDCPKRNDSQSDGVCFKCGSMEHSIHQCKKKGVKGFPYATCFVCKQIGHISRDCHQNLNGVYPDGGACNVCGATNHLKRDCPELAAQKAGGAFNQKKHFTARAASNWASQSADADYDPTENSGNSGAQNGGNDGFKKAAATATKKTAKHIKF